jgi:hypothetical protein
MTRAPAALPSWTAPLPTPPAAAWTSSVSPGARCPRRCSPNHLVGKGERRRLGVVQPLRGEERTRRVHQGVLGEGPGRQRRTADHAVAGREAGDVRGRLDDLTAQLGAEGERQRRPDLVRAPAEEHVGEVGRRREHPDQELPGSGHRPGHLGQLEDVLRLAVPAHLPGFHPVSFTIRVSAMA